MTTTESKLLTAEDLLRLHSKGVRGELINGVLHETMSTGAEHGEIVIRLGRHLANFVEPQGLGRLMGSDAGVLLTRDPDTVREPDLAFTTTARIPLTGRVKGYLQVVPDLAVEIVSPNDDLEVVYDKARMWLSFGVKMVWVVNPETRSVDVHHHEQPRQIIEDGGSLDGLDVLPGFTCPLVDIFGEPS